MMMQMQNPQAAQQAINPQQSQSQPPSANGAPQGGNVIPMRPALQRG